MEKPLRIAKALADGNRMRVIAALLGREELCVCQIVEMLQLSAATVSRHVSILQNAHLVEGRKDGRWVFYRLADPFPSALRSWLLTSLADSPEVASDRTRLEAILICSPEEICRRQKERHPDDQVSPGGNGDPPKFVLNESIKTLPPIVVQAQSLTSSKPDNGE
jgi:ArsR family transcriptional regulator, arsenate/arsenite/antimonite-responsive transcriptional repressor